MAGGHHPADRAVGRDQMLLADDLLKLGRPQAIRQRSGGLLLEETGHAINPAPQLTRKVLTSPPRLTVIDHSSAGVASNFINPSVLSTSWSFSFTMTSPGRRLN
jgi:hypothetical protein